MTDLFIVADQEVGGLERFQFGVVQSLDGCQQAGHTSLVIQVA